MTIGLRNVGQTATKKESKTYFYFRMQDIRKNGNRIYRETIERGRQPGLASNLQIKNGGKRAPRSVQTEIVAFQYHH